MNNYFSSSYAIAKEKFLTFANRENFTHESFCYKDDLSMDVLFYNPGRAEKLIVIFSGTHGVEGFCGSACQIAFMDQFNNLNSKQYAYCLIHAVNPYGFKYLSRTNENNVDINRNFIDFSKPLPCNPVFDVFMENLKNISLTTLQEVDHPSKFVNFVKPYLLSQVVQEIYKGQYTYPSGIFFGGTELNWSSQMLMKILNKVSINKKQCLLLDIHSGLGEFGQSQLIYCPGFDVESYDQARAIFGTKLTSWQTDDAINTAFNGKMMMGLTRRLRLPSINVTIEFGTVAKFEVIKALLASTYVVSKKITAVGMINAIQQQVKCAFYPEQAKWQQAVVTRFMETLKCINQYF